MKIYSALFVLFIISPPTAETIRPIPLVWCDANYERWGESGTICHSDPAERKPVICGNQNEKGEFTVKPAPINRGFCLVPKGFSTGPSTPLYE